MKADVLFFDRKPASEEPWTKELWIYDLRTNQHFAIRGACLAAIDQGIALLRSDDRADSAAWLYRLAVRSQREALPAERPVPLGRPAAAPESVAEGMLAAVPGISTVTARALLERFGSVAAMIDAPAESLLDVPGIGPERARALGQALGRG